MKEKKIASNIKLVFHSSTSTFMCLLRFAPITEIISLYSINRLWFVMEVRFAYREDINGSFKRYVDEPRLLNGTLSLSLH